RMGAGAPPPSAAVPQRWQKRAVAPIEAPQAAQKGAEDMRGS
ncbi:MAG: hypothetical protein RI891_1288, partial [Gemmatimonadota bacterium]